MILVCNPLQQYFIFLNGFRVDLIMVDMGFILTTAFVWKVALVTAVSSLPLYIIQCINLRLRPPSYSKIEG
jgi:phospholipid-translocating ATPase